MDAQTSLVLVLVAGIVVTLGIVVFVSFTRKKYMRIEKRAEEAPL